MLTALLIEFFISTPTSVTNVERLTNPPNETAAETPTVTFIPKTAKSVPLKFTAKEDRLTRRDNDDCALLGGGDAARWA